MYIWLLVSLRSTPDIYNLHCTVYSHMMYQLFLVINHWFTLSDPVRLFPLGCPGHAPKRATQSHEFLAFKTQSMQICSFRIDHGFHQLSKSPAILNHSNSVKWGPSLFPLHGTSQVERGSWEKKRQTAIETDSFWGLMSAILCHHPVLQHHNLLSILWESSWCWIRISKNTSTGKIPAMDKTSLILWYMRIFYICE